MSNWGIYNYNEVVITNVKVISTTVTNQSGSTTFPTKVNSTITGNNGQKIVYKITAQNFSKTDTYVYTGYSSNSNKISITASLDEQGSNLLNNNVSGAVHKGTAIDPGESFVFYVTYSLTSKLNSTEAIVDYVFKPVIYSVTYLYNNDLYALEYVTNNQTAYNVITNNPTQSGVSFAGWVNANAVVVTTISAGNTHDYTLSASWDKIYLIIFADAYGNILYQEQFTSSATALSKQGQETVDQILADLNAEAASSYMSVSWSDYTIKGAKADITVKAIYAYNGDLNLVPVYEQPDDGIVDYYKVVAKDTLPDDVVVPGSVGGVPVKVVERIANTEGENDWNNYADGVKTITIEEGVEKLEWNSLAWTPNLTTVKLPSTINYLAKNTFSRNDLFGNDKKTLTIEFNGTMAQWKAILKNSDSSWDGGLKDGSVVKCTDGYFELDKGLFSSSWKEKSY